jgi:ribokinase
MRGLEIAHAAGVATIFNPAPAEPVPDAIYPFCDYVTPNESEASLLTGVKVVSLDDARRAGDVFLGKGVRAALITLGENGALLHSRSASLHVPAFNAGPVVETAGAGDAFNGGFAAALARGDTPETAARFGCAVAGISVTRPGTAPSMPTLAEVKALLARP